MGNEHVSYIYLYDHMHGNLTCVGKNTEKKLVITPDEKIGNSRGVQFSALWDNLTHEAV